MSQGQRPLRVGQVVRPATGGMRRHVSTLLAHLDTTRFHPFLYAPADFTLDFPSPIVEHIPLAIHARTHPLADLRAILKLAKDLRQNCDIVHAHGLRGAWIGVLAARHAGSPSLFTAHNLVSSPSALQRLLLAQIGRYTARVIAVSQAVAETLVVAGLPRDKILVIPNGIDLTPFDTDHFPQTVRARYGIASDSPLIVSVGRFAPEKGFDTLLEAFQQHIHPLYPQARLALVGDGPLESELKRLAAKLSEPSARAVIFTGRVPDASALLRAADLVAIPSRQEGQGLVALEAMAARKPVVASRVGGLVETVVEGETGLLVPPDDPKALALALTALLSDEPRRQKMGEAGRKLIEQEYTVERMIGRIEEVYDSLTLSSSAGSAK